MLNTKSNTATTPPIRILSLKGICHSKKALWEGREIPSLFGTGNNSRWRDQFNKTIVGLATAKKIHKQLKTYLKLQL